ncbi:glycoside hydrolase family 2 TIM barrel-domain containing protein [Flavivirga spongiicola]|uniref:Cellulase family glycosylhydrolase n=1 Tax=Flavivirga spongiicola TaxID=421621 RepID=A0ABU7Y038_9FLAO|nr:glycoside hydrolase family 2 TIM barrel-domain containing protein [Flavivirga sp. MEBiC05379]MDO5981065.1 glycoside hydrolase family 2 TIM barrel-domain containing protein [Flavivirga sp. MEBiC05379]
MIGINKNILRVTLILSYIAIIALVVFGISSLYSYLNTGADRSSILHTEIKKIDQYLPKIVWAPLNNEGRPMDMQTLNTIENDYLDAWYVKHIAYKTNKAKGIDDYYTDSARENIFNIIEHNTTENIAVEGTTLEHHPTLEFFSEDGQLAVITDKDVVEYKCIYENKNIILETTEKSTYKIILLLEDGFWRIRHMMKVHSEIYNKKEIPSSNQITPLKGINYYPQDAPWDMFGDTFNLDIISKDFKLIKEVGLNSIRLFVPYVDFGKANVNTEKLKKLTQVLDLAEIQELKVLVTLFDFYGDYSVLDWTLNQRHAETIVTTLKNHNALLAWDIKNEPNLDFESRGQEHVIAWLNHMIDLVKSIDQEHPITIGWSNAKSATILKDKLDLITFHYYEDLNDLEKTYQDLKQKTPNKSIAITEFGMSSYKGLWNPFGNSEKNQMAYHKQAQNIFHNYEISSMSWTLYDFTKIPKEVVGRLPWHKRAQEHFGFINQNGETKPAFKFISKQ